MECEDDKLDGVCVTVDELAYRVGHGRMRPHVNMARQRGMVRPVARCAGRMRPDKRTECESAECGSEANV